MKAWIMNKIVPVEAHSTPLELIEMPIPEPESNELLVKVSACGVCHTELDEIEGRTPPPTLPVIPGHQVVGTIVKHGHGAGALPLGSRVGISWIYSACGRCPACNAGYENLCREFKGTGRDAHGGYAEFITVREAFAIPVPPPIPDLEAAPLLCAGAVGYRALCAATPTADSSLGLTGFGASGHLVFKMIRRRYPRARICIFARNETQRRLARAMGADWVGATDECPPFRLTAIIDTTPAWKPVVKALENLLPGGRLVINAIRKEDHDKAELMDLDYGEHLWMEKEIKSVANVTRNDVHQCLGLAAASGIRPVIQTYDFLDANSALSELRHKRNMGAKVLCMPDLG